jgi:hypothetical protein
MRYSQQLLHGPYNAPTLRRGDQTSCLARLRCCHHRAQRWPRCRALGTHGGGSGILVDHELARAIRCESAAAIRYWWGASVSTIAWWRRALGVTVTNNPRSGELLHDAARAGAAAMREREWTEEEGDARSATAIRFNLGQYLRRYKRPDSWSVKQLALLGTVPDANLARRLGRTADAVRLKRTRLGIPSALDRRRRENREGKPRAKRRERGPNDYRGPRYRRPSRR